MNATQLAYLIRIIPGSLYQSAEIHRGRWNSKGVALVYTSQSRSLAFAEVAMHIPISIVPTDYYLVSIKFPDATVAFLNF